MKISGHILIDKPIATVIRFFGDPAYLSAYQDGFIKKEHLSGDEGKEGAIAMLYYKNGKHQIDLEETITKNELPKNFEAIYRHKHMDNTMKCSFKAVSNNQTRYNYEYHYIRMTAMPRLMSWLNPGMFRKPAEKWLQQFKDFVEKQ